MTVPEAAAVFGVSGGASMNEIHARYCKLAKTWHPDISEQAPGLSHDTFIRIKDAYDILVDYCMNFEISFRPEDIRKGTGYDSKEFWMSRFGNDPIWE